jgi:hypothetical protein
MESGCFLSDGQSFRSIGLGVNTVTDNSTFTMHFGVHTNFIYSSKQGILSGKVSTEGWVQKCGSF